MKGFDKMVKSQVNDECRSNVYPENIDKKKNHWNNSGSCDCAESSGYNKEVYLYSDKCGNNSENMDDNLEYSNCAPPVGYNSLPNESRRFQTITNINTNNNGHRVLDAMNTSVGQPLESIEACSSVSATNTVLNEQVRFLNDTQFFVFYQLDDGNFLIANKGNGRVLEVVPNAQNGFVTISSIYSGSNLGQRIRLERQTNDNFRLISQGRAINVCGQFAQQYTSITAVVPSWDSTRLFRFRTENMNPISLPNLPEPTNLEPLPQLTGLNDSGLSPRDAPRAIIGSTLIPCIFVKDVIPLEQRIKTSPYYVLQYRQYWHRLWSFQFAAGEGRTISETTGILPNAQENMRDTIDISIGADWDLRFFANSTPFRQQINSGLATQNSFTDTNLGLTTVETRYTNPNFSPTRFAMFVKGYEYVLTRLDGTVVSSPWVALEGRSSYLKSFPNNATLLMENQKIVYADNSYDLSVYKTPRVIRNNQIICKR